MILRAFWIKELIINGWRHISKISQLNEIDLSKICQENINPDKILRFLRYNTDEDMGNAAC